jgi:tellurite methyltransferase
MPIVSGLSAQFGQIDIYLFDQLLRGRVSPGSRILDAGCGDGRNLVYLLRAAADERYEIFGVDSDPPAIAKVRRLAASLAPGVPATNFRLESIEDMTFPDALVDMVISSAVLHFASSDAHFQSMLYGMWRILKPGGLFFCRLASSIGIESRVEQISGRRGRLPDGSERYLVTEAMLMELTERLGSARMEDPLKTTVVQDQRAMTTWVLRKHA